jgi:hypothetical protein
VIENHDVQGIEYEIVEIEEDISILEGGPNQVTV